jgi:putative transposase
LRAKYKEGSALPVRPTGPKSIRLPKLGDLQVRECTKRFRRMLQSGRFHAYEAAFRYERGRWVVAITGLAAPFHHARHDTTARHQDTVGVDLGLTTLVTVADTTGALLEEHKGVKALQHDQARLKLANQVLARTKRGSTGRKTAARRLGKAHARVAGIRKQLLHELTTALVTGYAHVVIEDLNVAGMIQLRSLARHVSDAAFGEFRRQLTYKTAWYGTRLTVADRWFPSSKTCSGCGTVKTELALADRTYECGECGLVIGRDLNAAINLARYALAEEPTTSPPHAAAA